MTDRVHGYYINGKASWDNSDLPMGELKKKLDDEMKGNPGTRTRAFGI